ncbi:T6SS effector BTH_I2691 family protein [Achromobacter marplatensis]|uniref:T6SS effector BTH_I2691 family protein n=1 Tax=Achromobacter marplatensis TaxID=470868 RepID=UPI0039F6E5B3
MSNACSVCQAGGLPILPTRYAVVPASFPQAGLSDFSGERVTGVELDASRYKYVTRTLRQGFLYLFYEKGPQGANYWEVYSVTADGTLWRCDDADSARLEPSMKCASQGHNPLRMHYIVIEKPEQCGTVWLAYSEHKWSPQTRARYATPAHRASRMQAIEPSVWAQGTCEAKNHQSILAVESNFKKILEYGDHQFSSLTGEPPALPCTGFDRVRVLSRADGSYDEALLTEQFTKTPWYPRNRPVGDRKDLVLQQLLAQMLDKCGDPTMGVSYWPMALALWDAIGIADELNGYCNDALGAIARYGEERALEITAISNIEGAKAALEGKADDAARRTAEAVQLGQRSGSRHYEVMRRNQIINQNVQDMPGKQALAGLENERSNGVISNAEYQRRRGLLLDQYVPAARRAQAEADFNAYDAEIALADRTRDQNLENYRQDRVRQAWDRYNDNIDWDKLRRFKGNYDRFQEAATTLANARTVELIKWLEWDLLFDTLEDYSEDVEDDGHEFIEVVADMTEGIGASEAGARYLKTLVEVRRDASDRRSLFWRAVAANQKALKPQVTAAVDEAVKGKQTLLSVGLAIVERATSNLKTFAGYYKRAVSLVGESNAQKLGPLPRAMKNAGVDKLMMTAGDTVFRWLRLNGLGDYVGEKIIQNIFLMSTGISDADALALVRQQARYDGVARQVALQRLRTARTFLEANEAIAKEPGHQVMRDMWSKIRPANGRNGATTMRITVVVGLIELVNFTKLIAATDKTTTTYAKLIASAATLSAAVIDIAIVPYQLAGKKAFGFQKWKLMGGMLGAGASFITASIDFNEATERREKKQYKLMVLVGIKSALGFTAAGAAVITAIATSAPLLKIVGRRLGLNVVVIAVDGIAARVAVASVARVLGLLVGWEIAVVLVGIQLLAWYFTPDTLEEWCETSAFGRRTFGTPVDDPKKQEEGFVAALADVV